MLGTTARLSGLIHSSFRSWKHQWNANAKNHSIIKVGKDL